MAKTLKQIDGELSTLRIKMNALKEERDVVVKAEEKKKREEYNKYIGKLVWFKNKNAKVWKLGIFRKSTTSMWNDGLQYVVDGMPDELWDMIKVATFDDVKNAIYVEPKKESK